MGGGLTADEARDARIPTHRSRYVVGKLAYLTTDPMTIQEDRRAIAKAISDH